MSNIFTKLKDMVSFTEPVDYEYEYDEMEGENYTSSYNPPKANTDTEAARAARSRPFPLTANPSFSTADLGSPTLGTRPSSGMTTSSNVVGLPGAAGGISEVVVMEPRSFEEMPQAIQALRGRKSLVLNLTLMDADQAQRAVDFIAGGTYALDGHQERIGESIFLFTPSCVQVSTQSGVVRDVMQPHLRSGAGGGRPAATPANPPGWTGMPGQAVQ